MKTKNIKNIKEKIANIVHANAEISESDANYIARLIITAVKRPLVDLCEDNDEMKIAITNFFDGKPKEE